MATNKKLNITKEVLEDLYLVQKKNQREIAEIYDCDRKNIDYYLKKYGIKKRTFKESQQLRLGNTSIVHNPKYKFSDVTVESIMELVDKGYYIKQICEHFGVSRGAINKRLKKAGISLRNHENVLKRRSEVMKNKNPNPKGNKRDPKELQASIEARKKIAREKWWNITDAKLYQKKARYIAYKHYDKGKSIPEGMVIDHIFSIWDGWRYGVYVEDISHPSNLRLVPEKWNIEKSYKSHMSFDEFKRIVPEVRFFRDKLPNPKCEGCGKEFEQSIGGKKYCSISCYEAHRVYHVEKTCEICGKDFTVTSKRTNPKTKTCSKECSSKLRSLSKKMK